jgi:small subunit ribosomal protein S27Ae
MGGQEGGKKGKTRQREKKQRTGKKHSNVSITTAYRVEGGSLRRTKKTCPRCGDGTYLASHKNRDYCGRCGYTLFHRKEQNEKGRAAPPENKESEQPVPGTNQSPAE